MPTIKKPTVLVIMDGFGLADQSLEGNAITKETAPNIFGYMQEYPSAELKAHGEAVGLFPDQEGNSEAGHFAIGAGRPVEQDLVHISSAITDGTFYKNAAFQQAADHAKKHKSSVHIMGLLTNSDSAHANPKHLYALLETLRNQKVVQVYLHLFTDGRDSGMHGAVHFLQELRNHMQPHEKIATIMGRFYGMDRNKIWERTEVAYNTLVRAETTYFAESAEQAIGAGYSREETDEYISPTIITEHHTPIATIQDNDAVIFFNARSDRARQITKAFVQKDFAEMNPGAFVRESKPENIIFVAMTDFGPDLPGILTAFPSPDISNCLAKAIGEEREQLYISETEKYAHVTYFINGGYPKPINGEVRELVESSGHYSYADHPQMMSKKVATKIIDYLQKKKYDFVCVNFPNADMVGHTGNFTAAKKAVRELDSQIARLVDAVLELDGQVVITADHGNAEEMIHLNSGEAMTQHTTNPVPFIVISHEKVSMKKKGTLADVAPTLLTVMDISIPKEMTGKSLIE